MQKLTGETITDEQIKELRDHSDWWTVAGDIDIVDCCNRALGHKDGPNRFQQLWTIEECRTEIAKILNTRNEATRLSRLQQENPDLDLDEHGFDRSESGYDSDEDQTP